MKNNVFERMKQYEKKEFLALGISEELATKAAEASKNELKKIFLKQDLIR